MGFVRWVHAALLASGLAVGVSAGPAPPPEDIELPAPAVVVPPAPAPPPVTALSGDAVYDVRCRGEGGYVLLARPDHLVTVTRKVLAAGQEYEKDARFVDGSGAKSWKGPCTLYFVKAAGTASGTVYLDVFPLGLKSESQVRSVALKVNGGGPDPKVDPKPDPKVDPKPDPAGPTAARVSVVVVEETQARTVAQGKVLYDAGVRDWLKAGGHEIEVLDKDDKAAADHGYLPYAGRVGLPAVLVFDADGQGPQVPLAQFRLPATAAEFRSGIGKAVRK